MPEHVVLFLDASLHLMSFFLLGFSVSFIVKLFSRGQVDFRLLGGLFTVFVVTVVRHFVEPKIAFSLAGVSPEVHFSALITVLTIAAMIVIYQQFTVLFFATVFSSVTVVTLTIFGNDGIKKLSLHLMPEGQRFAEYAGFASEQTSELMEKAKNFKKKDGLSTWKKALNAIGFLTSEEEKQTLSRDFSAGIEVYKQRKAFMDSMTDEELAEYRKAMAQFLDEQGLSENRYSLSNLKNAKPEDLANLGSFMKELNAEVDPSALSEEGDIPFSADSLRVISDNLNRTDLSDEDKIVFQKILSLLNNDDLETGIEKARSELKKLKFELPEGQNLFSVKRKFRSKVRALLELSKSYRPSSLDLEYKDEAENSDEVTLLKKVELGDQYVASDLSKYSSNRFKTGVLLLPPNETDPSAWLGAISAVPFRAWFIARGEVTVTRVVIDNTTLGLGEYFEFEHKGQYFVFRLEEVTAEGIHMSALNPLSYNR